MTPSDIQGPPPGRDAEAHDDDPTGIRDLLAALPDPGPMPADLVARIEARLAVEQAHRERASTPGGLGTRSDAVVDLAAERSHRRPGRTVALMGAAAAGLLVATVAIGELGGMGPSAGPAFDSAAQVPARSGADSAGSDAGGEQQLGASGGGSSEAGRDEQGDGTVQEDGAPGDADEEAGALGEVLPGDVVVLPELGAVGADDYQDRIVALFAQAPPPARATGGLTPTGAQWCWETVEPSAPWPSLRAAQAEMDGQRVVVLLGAQDEDAGTGEALVLPWTCTAGHDVEPVHSVAWSTP